MKLTKPAAWLRWQAACLADDFRRSRRQLHDWLNGYGEYSGTGRHCYDTGQIRIISMELAARPWPEPQPPAEWRERQPGETLGDWMQAHTAPAPCPRHGIIHGTMRPADWAGECNWRDICPADPPCQQEDNWTCGYHGGDWDPEQARLRATAPRLFAPPERYWGLRLVDFYGWVAWQAAERNRFRDDCGLPRIELAPPSARQLSAA